MKLNTVHISSRRSRLHAACGVLSGLLLWLSASAVAFARATQPASKSVAVAPPSVAPAMVADAALVAAVRPFQGPAADQGRPSERSRQLMQEFYDSILDWAKIVDGNFRPVPGHPDWGYYGLPGNNEDEIRPITYAVQVNAFLSAIDPPSARLDSASREHLRAQAIAALRYLTHSHVTGGGQCLNGKPWGNAWQSAMWSRSVGLGGWLLWRHLDGPLKTAVARLVEFEADRFLAQAPRDQEFSNTGAEENAWNAMITSLGANMMPGHPRAPDWNRCAKLYLYNSLSRQADHQDQTMGDDHRAIGDWVTTVNAHPDFTIENHGLVHVGYLKLTVGEMFENVLHYLMGGTTVPQACFHNTDGAYEVLLRCMSWDGAPISFGGNDWKIVHTQCTDIVLHTYLGLFRSDSVAAYLEQVSLETLRRIQKDEGGFYNVRRDLEYGGFCATRLMACYLAHALHGPPTAPASAEAFNRRASGLAYLEHGKAILHRTPTKFASFTWGPNRMALALPSNGTWVVWPHYASYLGEINGKNASQKEAQVATLNHQVGTDHFEVCGRLLRAKATIQHDFAYASLPADVTVYIERLRGPPGGRIGDRETGIVGHYYPLGQNERLLRGRHGSTRVSGIGGRREVIPLPTDWLNVGDRIGYVVRRTAGRVNIMRYHDEERGSGRVPLLQEYLSLIGDDTQAEQPEVDWACVVTFLNQPCAETERWADQVKFAVESDTAACEFGRDLVKVDFKSLRVTVSAVNNAALRR